MSRHPRAELLEELRAGLGGLLASLESVAADSTAALENAGARLSAAYERVRADLCEHGPFPGELRASLESCMRLYAVSSVELARHREALAGEQVVCAAARTRLRRMSRARTSRNSGDRGSCDVRA